MREAIKGVAVIAAAGAAIALGIFAAIWLFTWWLFTGVFLETDAEMLEIPKPPLIFSQYTRQGHYDGYLCGYGEEMEYNEYYYRSVSFSDQPNFQSVTQENISEILAFVQNYEQKLDAIKGRTDEDADQLYRRYRYDPDGLSSGDYYRVEAWDEEQLFTDYRLYIFDHEAKTLYYMYYRQV